MTTRLASLPAGHPLSIPHLSYMAVLLGIFLGVWGGMFWVWSHAEPLPDVTLKSATAIEAESRAGGVSLLIRYGTDLKPEELTLPGLVPSIRAALSPWEKDFWDLRFSPKDNAGPPPPLSMAISWSCLRHPFGYLMQYDADAGPTKGLLDPATPPRQVEIRKVPFFSAVPVGYYGLSFFWVSVMIWEMIFSWQALKKAGRKVS